MALIDSALLAQNDTNFVRRCQVAAVKTAIAVQAEDPSALALPPGYKPTGAADDTAKKQKLHEVRVALAQSIVSSPEHWGKLFATAIAADPNSAGITTNSSDNDITFTAIAVYNSFAITGNS